MKDIKVITNAEAIKALSDSFRLKILNILQLEGKASATHIAEEMGESASKISYHIKILEKHDIIKLEDTLIKGNIVEKIYTPVAREFKLKLKTKNEKEGIDGNELYPIVKELSTSIENDLFELANRHSSLEDDSSSVLSYGSYYLTEEEAEELTDHIMNKLREFMGRKKGVINDNYNEYRIGFLVLNYFSKSSIK
ncbi:MAG: ArsR/SmtB family transcription factor [Halanaerobiales bacterium]